MDKQSAIQLSKKVESLIDEAQNLKREVDFGAVNWGDISVRDVCVETSYLHDEKAVYVDIEEAHPDCYLATWLTIKLETPYVIVRASW